MRPNLLNAAKQAEEPPPYDFRKWAAVTGQNEGFSKDDYAYLDNRHILTIGYGFNLEDPVIRRKLQSRGFDVDGMIKKKVKMTKAEALPVLEEIYKESFDTAKKKFPNFDTFPDDVKHVVTDMVFNMGEGRFDGFKKMKAALLKNDYAGAAREIADSSYAKQVGNRAKRNMEVLNTIQNAPNIEPFFKRDTTPVEFAPMREATSVSPSTPAVEAQPVQSDMPMVSAPEARMDSRDKYVWGPSGKMTVQDFVDQYGEKVFESTFKSPVPKFANGGPILPREEGYYDFNEVPEKSMFYNMERAEQLYTPDETGHWPSIDYETNEWLKSKEHPTAWMEYLYGYTLNPQQALNYNVRTNPEGYFGENTLQYTPIVKSLSKKENGGLTLPYWKDLDKQYYINSDRTPREYKSGGWTDLDRRYGYYGQYPGYAYGSHVVHGGPTWPEYAMGLDSGATLKQTLDVLKGNPTPKILDTSAQGNMPKKTKYPSNYAQGVKKYSLPEEGRSLYGDGGSLTDEYRRVRSTIPRVSFDAPSRMYTGPTTQRGITFRNGGPTDPEPPVESGLATQVVRAGFYPFLPTNARQLAASMITGDSNYGLQDAPEGERIALFNTLENARKRTGQNKGGTEYVDYGSGYNADLERLQAAPLNVLAGSALSSDFNAATTFGRVSYEYDPKTQTYKVYDSYDFSKTPNTGTSYSQFRSAVGEAAATRGISPKGKTPNYIGSMSKKEYQNKTANPGLLDFSYSDIKNALAPINSAINTGYNYLNKAADYFGFKDGGPIDPGKKSIKQALLDYKEGEYENPIEFFDFSGISSYDDAARAYDAWQKSGTSLPTGEQSLDMFGAVPALGKLSYLRYLDPNSIKTAYKFLNWQKAANMLDYIMDSTDDKKEDGGWLDSYEKGGMIKRADGSYSRRGLWDNIRANRGSGKKPTKEMLKQERKIRAAEKKADGSFVGIEPMTNLNIAEPRYNKTPDKAVMPVVYANEPNTPDWSKGAKFADGGPTGTDSGDLAVRPMTYDTPNRVNIPVVAWGSDDSINRSSINLAGYEREGFGRKSAPFVDINLTHGSPASNKYDYSYYDNYSTDKTIVDEKPLAYNLTVNAGIKPEFVLGRKSYTPKGREKLDPMLSISPYGYARMDTGILGAGILGTESPQKSYSDLLNDPQYTVTKPNDAVLSSPTYLHVNPGIGVEVAKHVNRGGAWPQKYSGSFEYNTRKGPQVGLNARFDSEQANAGTKLGINYSPKTGIGGGFEMYYNIGDFYEKIRKKKTAPQNTINPRYKNGGEKNKNNWLDNL